MVSNDNFLVSRPCHFPSFVNLQVHFLTSRYDFLVQEHRTKITTMTKPTMMAITIMMRRMSKMMLTERALSKTKYRKSGKTC